MTTKSAAATTHPIEERLEENDGDGAAEIPTGQRREANVQLVAGLGLGVYAAGSLALLGAVCPVCVVASPLLVGAGLLGRRRATRGTPRKAPD